MTQGMFTAFDKFRVVASGLPAASPDRGGECSEWAARNPGAMTRVAVACDVDKIVVAGVLLGTRTNEAVLEALRNDQSNSQRIDG